jgi:hypothetical protein
VGGWFVVGEHIKEIVNSLNNIDILAIKIIMHGLQLAAGIIFSALIICYINNMYHYRDFSIAFTSIYMVKTGVIIFAEAIIGGLVVDYLIKKQGRTN